MPPVRWKTLYITLLIFHQGWTITDAQEMRGAISMTSDGWRPIIGTAGRQPSTHSETRHSQYKSPGQKVEFDIVKSENTAALPSTVKPQKFVEASTNSINHINAGNIHSIYSGGKIPPHSKFPPQPSYHTLPPSQPPKRQQGQFGGYRKHPQKQEAHHHSHLKRKPMVRGPTMAHSNREEVYVHPPINIPYLKLGPSNVKTRETQGLSFVGKNHFTVNQPNTHAEINRFPHPPTNDDVFEQFKSQSLVFPKLNNQQDVYTRNLVPPPPNRHLAEKEKLKSAKIPAHLKDNVATVSEPVIEFHDLGLQGFVQHRPQVQENLVQLPFEQSLAAFHQQFGPREPPSEVQVTKEKVKVWQNALPNRLNPKLPDYAAYDFHSLTNQGQLPKLQTYEVTEGKWVDEPNPYTFAYQQQPQQKRPPSVGSARPQLVAEPLVELNVPPFLPTPYRPTGPFPTSSTVSEASTVFSKVSQKMNKYKSEALNNNPLFFDIKEVSTHYPILGQPAFTQESQTDSSVAIGDISNEITTQKPKTRRRRPQPRRPTTTTTPLPPPTTTEDASQSTESYDFQKVQVTGPEAHSQEAAVDASVSSETERPRRRKRPTKAPSRGRYEGGSGSVENDQERPSRYRTTPAAVEGGEDSEEKRMRGRHRHRQRGNKDSNEIRNVHLRKRLRPTTTEMPANHKVSDDFSSSMSEESSREPTGFSQEAYRNRYQPQDEDIAHSQEAYRNRYQPQDEDIAHSQEVHRNRYQPQDEDIAQSHESTNSRYKLRDDGRVETSVAGGLIEEITERVEEVGTTTTEAATIVNINLPENEIDYPTPSNDVDVRTTLATTVATTASTTTSTEDPQTARPGGKVRPRLPIKYNGGRPRFSVKEYRQRLSQYASTTSTTPSTTTDFVRTTSERLRFPNRLRSRPPHAAAPTRPPPGEDEQSTDQILRRKFVPKDPRHGRPSTTPTPAPSSASAGDGGGRDRSGGGGSLFHRKRPAALRSKYFGRPERNMTEATTEIGAAAAPTVLYQDDSRTTTEAAATSATPTAAENVLDQDDYSQRVSELTSSFKTEYETPGLFKSVSPNSRRVVPSYFTISTDDPILPIEAFFPHLKDRERGATESELQME